MNRTVLFGGVAAVVVLLGTAGYLIYAGRGPSTTGGPTGAPDGPVTANPVTVITEHTNNLSQDGKRLSLGFPGFELRAKSGETTSAVFSTTWHIKVGADERVVVATSTLNGFMKSAGTPPPPAATEAAPVATATPAAGTPAATPDAAPAATPATDPAATPAAETSAATPAEQPKPAAPSAPAGPVAGDGVARVIVAIGSEATVSEWRDHSGTGADRKLSKAVSYVASQADLRDGGSIPVTVTIEVSGGASQETLAKLNSIDLQVFTENAPVAAPAAEAPATPAATPAAPAADGATPAAPAPAETPAPASGTNP